MLAIQLLDEVSLPFLRRFERDLGGAFGQPLREVRVPIALVDRVKALPGFVPQKDFGSGPGFDALGIGPEAFGAAERWQFVECNPVVAR